MRMVLPNLMVNFKGRSVQLDDVEVFTGSPATYMQPEEPLEVTDWTIPLGEDEEFIKRLLPTDYDEFLACAAEAASEILAEGPEPDED